MTVYKFMFFIGMASLFLSLHGCATAPTPCPEGDQTTECKCYRSEYPWTMCKNTFFSSRRL